MFRYVNKPVKKSKTDINSSHPINNYLRVVYLSTVGPISVPNTPAKPTSYVPSIGLTEPPAFCMLVKIVTE